MPVFKLCFKILKKNMFLMTMYIVIFIVVSIIMAFASANEQKNLSSFTQEKRNIVFITEDSSPLVEGLKQELGKIANFVDIPDQTEALQDALYFRVVTYVLRIPRGFTEAFMRGEDVQVEKTVAPASYGNLYIDLTVDKYLNTARLYVNQLENLSLESLVERLRQDLSQSTVTELGRVHNNTGSNAYLKYYYNYLPYSLINILIFGMAELAIVFNNSDLRKRNACSPLSSKSMNLQYMLANVVFALLSWFITVAVCFALNFKKSLNMSTVYYMLNFFVFAICAATMSFMLGNLVNRGAITAVSNVVSLGLSFISGVFVPQEFIGSYVLKVASFTPTYWYVYTNDRIAELTQFDFEKFKYVLPGMLIQLCFALAFFSVAMVIAKKKRLS